jgi:hypothetical protein
VHEVIRLFIFYKGNHAPNAEKIRKKNSPMEKLPQKKFLPSTFSRRRREIRLQKANLLHAPA